MTIQIKIKKLITVIAISFIVIIIIRANVPQEASAFTLKPNELLSAISEKEKDSSQNMFQPNRFFPASNNQDLVVSKQKKDDVLFQTAEEEKSTSSFDKGVIPGTNRSDFNLIQGDFCLTVVDHSNRFSHFTDDRDDLGHTPSPSPVSLPATALLFGTGLGVLFSLTARKEDF
jgi:hypothetical protein